MSRASLPRALLTATLVSACAAVRASEPLPSWEHGPARTALVDFVEAVTRPGTPDFVPAPERIAVFDNDGTLWAEQPMYFQLAFALDRVRELAPRHPEWKQQEPFRSVLAGDMEQALAGGEKAILELVMAAHAGNTSEEFSTIVARWLDTAHHPRTGKRYDEMVYQPMLEVLAYLRANGFKTFLVSGGGIEFMRVFAERVYGVPPEQVVGSSIVTEYELREGEPVLVRQPEIAFVDDKEGKPVGIQQHIGRRPLVAFGNSDGDFQMLEWTTAGPGRRLGVLVHHDDAAREWAYDRESHIGQLQRGLDEGPRRGWVIVSQRRDWRRVFAGEGS